MKSFISFLLAILFLSTSCQKIKNQEIYIIPQPQQVNFGTSLFSFDTNTMIVFSTDENLRQQVVYFSELIDAAFGFKIEAIPAVEGKSKNSVSLVIVDDLEDLGEEGYKIKIEKNNVLIEANSPKGTFSMNTKVSSFVQYMSLKTPHRFATSNGPDVQASSG